MKIHQSVPSNKVQMYKMPHNNEGSRERAEPAQFVFEGNDSDFVAGFITEVDENCMTFCLFSAIDVQDLPTGAIPVHNEMSKVEMGARLDEAISRNPSMKEVWIDAVNKGESK